MVVDNRCIEIEADIATHGVFGGIVHEVAKCGSAVAGKNHVGLAVIVICVSVRLEVLAFVYSSTATKHGRHMAHRTCRIRSVCLPERMGGLVAHAVALGIIDATAIVVIVDHPSALVSGIDLGRSVGNTEIGWIHTLGNKLFCKLSPEVQESTRIVVGQRHCNVNLWSRVCTNVDCMGFLRV